MNSVRRLFVDTLNGRATPVLDSDYADGDDGAWRNVDWRTLIQRVQIGDSWINYLDTGGTGKPALILIHGLGGCWQNWLLNIPYFRERYRVIAPDLPGFGESDMPTEPISIESYGAVVDSLCHKLGIDQATIVGNSMGGLIATEIALSFPTRVRNLVLVSAAGLSTSAAERRRTVIVTLARLWGFVTSWTVNHREEVAFRPRLRKLLLHQIVKYPERLSPPLMLELIQGAGRPGFVSALAALMSYPLEDRLNSIECPVLIVWGRNDRLVPVSDAYQYEELIGNNAHKVIIEDTGHCLMLERPKVFNNLLCEFLNENKVYLDQQRMNGRPLNSE